MSFIRAVVWAGFCPAVDSFKAGFTVTYSLEAEPVVRTGVRTVKELTCGAGVAIFAETFPSVAVSYRVAVIETGGITAVFFCPTGVAFTGLSLHVACSTSTAVVRTHFDGTVVASPAAHTLTLPTDTRAFEGALVFAQLH